MGGVLTIAIVCVSFCLIGYMLSKMRKKTRDVFFKKTQEIIEVDFDNVI